MSLTIAVRCGRPGESCRVPRRDSTRPWLNAGFRQALSTRGAAAILICIRQAPIPSISC